MENSKDHKAAAEPPLDCRVSGARYWLCCGSLDQQHQDKRAKTCVEAKIGHPDHCRFGTAAEHSAWQRSTANA